MLRWPSISFLRHSFEYDLTVRLVLWHHIFECIYILLHGFRDAEDAVAISNDSIYGLAGAVWSNNINTAHRVAAAVRVGTMGINNYFGGDITVPFGGFKQSGNGRDKSMHAFDDYTELKTTWIEFD